MDHLNLLIERYGEPVSLSDEWASFHHGCAEEKKLGGGNYALIQLYNRVSGWVTGRAPQLRDLVRVVVPRKVEDLVHALFIKAALC